MNINEQIRRYWAQWQLAHFSARQAQVVEDVRVAQAELYKISGKLRHYSEQLINLNQRGGQ